MFLLIFYRKKNILEKNWMCKRTWKNWTPISCDTSCQNLSFDVEILKLFSSQFLKKLQSEIGFGRINNLWYIPLAPLSLGPHLSSICMKLARDGEIWSQTWDKGYVWKSIILLWGRDYFMSENNFFSWNFMEESYICCLI